MDMKKLHIETYGCQMNVADSEVVASILKKEGLEYTKDINEADVILLNTCSIREHAENKIFQRLNELKKLRAGKEDLIVGLIGCMAERLKDKLFEKKGLVDIAAGPDSYRSLPSLLEQAYEKKNALDVELSLTETYSEIFPYRYDDNGISAFVSIMRGCNNFCSYCIVPYTRGRERSRDAQSIIDEVKQLAAKGYKEVTLLGQNVNSYSYENEGQSVTFPQLLEQVALAVPNMRIRFTTSHPKDLSDDLLYVMAKYDNLAKWIHLPVQSGSTTVLQRMNRRYTREWYLDRVAAIRRILPEASITTDIMCGFSDETEAEQEETLSLMKEVGYDTAFMFKYSEREGTVASKRMPDNVPDDVKTKRLNDIIAVQNELSRMKNAEDEGKVFEVLVEGVSKKDEGEWKGRSSQNKTVVFPANNVKPGDFVKVKILSSSSATLRGEIA
ncbi:MAG: tRNA (N6-isopentenyl adenosine(37)-C2)-methylthiotransferase MiaB [Bacteroidales bacterium]|nr:tRNA (N6-isopentenyl adenosine(37)-C2)-methylthiotransferase MiaB [Bacteroidales bacterium]